MDTQLGIKNRAGTIAIVFQGTAFPSRVDPEALIDICVNMIAQLGKGKFDRGRSYTVTVDGEEGLAADLTGVLNGYSIQGRVVIVMLDNQQLYLGFGIAVTEYNESLWEDEGSKVFNAFLGSVKFLTPGSQTGPCEVSSDVTYGYTKGNPIKVGGGDFGGPPREKEYLNNLRGPNGEKLTYERQGSLPYEDTILDIYEMQGLKQPITLYVDEYSFTDPQAPMGFTCAGPFSLTEPK
jgi:hypothetical protein